jgi:enoyl-CoA hydratase/carnithine racemase
MNTINITKKDNYAIVQLDRGTSNAINLELLQELRQAFKGLAADDTVKGVVLTGKENFFSSGLDVIELYDYDEKKIELLFDTLFQAMREMLAFPKPFVASITGHAPAGGCVLAICADYRIMAEGRYRIGLNEVPVGIIIPQYIFETYAYWLGRGKAAQFILEGKLASTQEAIEVGLVDELSIAENVLQSSIDRMLFYTKFSANTWSKSKLAMRAALLDHYRVFDAGLKKDLMEQWWSKETRAILGALVAKLTNK